MADTVDERSPLLDRSSPNTNQAHHRRLAIKIFGLLLLGVAVFLAALNIFLSLVQTAEPVLNTDVSSIPLHYQLRITSPFAVDYRWDYTIEHPPPLDAEFSGEALLNELNKSNEKNATGTKEDVNYYANNDDGPRPEPRPRVIAELVSRVFKFWTPAYYEVREDRYDVEGNYIQVATTTASLDHWWIFTLYKTVLVGFPGSASLESTAKQACDYKIVWTFFWNAWIYRRCPKLHESEFTKVAYMKGSSQWGLEFFSPDQESHLAVATRPSLLDGLQKRIVFVYDDAPFPPVLPAICTAYYDYNSNRRNHRRDGGGDS